MSCTSPLRSTKTPGSRRYRFCAKRSRTGSSDLSSDGRGLQLLRHRLLPAGSELSRAIGPPRLGGYETMGRERPLSPLSVLVSECDRRDRMSEDRLRPLLDITDLDAT